MGLCECKMFLMFRSMYFSFYCRVYFVVSAIQIKLLLIKTASNYSTIVWRAASTKVFSTCNPITLRVRLAIETV